MGVVIADGSIYLLAHGHIGTQYRLTAVVQITKCHDFLVLFGARCVRGVYVVPYIPCCLLQERACPPSVRGVSSPSSCMFHLSFFDSARDKSWMMGSSPTCVMVRGA